jgi:hypothetical protein
MSDMATTSEGIHHSIAALEGVGSFVVVVVVVVIVSTTPV